MDAVGRCRIGRVRLVGRGGAERGDHGRAEEGRAGVG